jgi:hypothetical protein
MCVVELQFHIQECTTRGMDDFVLIPAIAMTITINTSSIGIISISVSIITAISTGSALKLIKIEYILEFAVVQHHLLLFLLLFVLGTAYVFVTDIVVVIIGESIAIYVVVYASIGICINICIYAGISITVCIHVCSATVN